MSFPPQGNGADVALALTAQQVRDALLSLPENERKFIVTDPGTGQHKVLAIRRNSKGELDYDFEDIPE